MCVLPQVNESSSLFFLDILRKVDKMSTCFSFVVIDSCDFETAIKLIEGC